MVSDWLKLEFIDSFFTLLAEDGESDSRRLNFWKQYVDEIDNIYFALGAAAQSSTSKDFVALLKKLNGISTNLGDGPASNNAFIMVMKGFVIVEFSGRANALYVYGGRHEAKFDVSRTVYGAKDVRNSLKSSVHLLWLKHKDATYGHATWEQAFAARLEDVCGIVPSRGLHRSRYVPYSASRFDSEPMPSASPSHLAAPESAQEPWTRSETDARSSDPRAPLPFEKAPFVRSGQTPEFSDEAFRGLAASYRLPVVDLRASGGFLWVREVNLSRELESVLQLWGFKFRATRGWWR